MPNRQCWHYDPIKPKEKVSCPNCTHWGWTRCKDEALLTEGVEYNREIENLMRHDSFTRGRGGIRQVRRG